jgi:hypothetical protein
MKSSLILVCILMSLSARASDFPLTAHVITTQEEQRPSGKHFCMVELKIHEVFYTASMLSRYCPPELVAGADLPARIQERYIKLQVPKKEKQREILLEIKGTHE